MLLVHRFFIRTALLFLFTGVALGGYMLVGKALGWATWSGVLITMHAHLILVGFMAMMVMGVAHWMFPRPVGKRREDMSADLLPWFNYGLLTLGLVLRLVTEPWLPADWARYGLVVSAILQLAGFACFLLAIWGRVRGATPLRPPSPVAGPGGHSS